MKRAIPITTLFLDIGGVIWLHKGMNEDENRLKDFRVPTGKEVKLKEWPTIVKPFCSI